MVEGDSQSTGSINVLCLPVIEASGGSYDVN